METTFLTLEGYLLFPLEGESANFHEYARSESTWRLPDEGLQWLQREIRTFQTSFQLKVRDEEINETFVSVGIYQIKLLGMIIQHNIICQNE